VLGARPSPSPAMWRRVNIARWELRPRLTRSPAPKDSSASAERTTSSHAQLFLLAVTVRRDRPLRTGPNVQLIPSLEHSAVLEELLEKSCARSLHQSSS